MRHIDNDASEFLGNIPNNLLESLRNSVPNLVKDLMRNYPPGADYMQDSRGQQKYDVSIYLGAGGNIVLYERLERLSGEYREQLERAIEACGKIASRHSGFRDPISFYMGKPGVYTCLGCILKDVRYIEKVLDMSSLVTSRHAEDELLYGNAGYLYCLVYILSKWSDIPLRDRIIQTINSTVQELIQQGNQEGVLKYTFPRGMEMYLGAAHGTIGILQTILLAYEYLTIDINSILLSTLDYILSLQLPSGNFPMIDGERIDEVIHFCHGSAGVVPMLCTAYKALKNPRYLDAAIKAGNDIWDRGLIKKGRGLCHGIAGNGYSFLSLYKVTQNEMWYYRAILFAYKLFNDAYLNSEILQYYDPQRLRRGVADTPYSLMEGLGGTICYMLDVLHPDSSSFPGYEL